MSFMQIHRPIHFHHGGGGSSSSTGCLNRIDVFMALHFTAIGEPPAMKRTRILPTTQHANSIWNDGKSYLCSQTTRGVENAVPLHVNIFHNSLFH
jgi:hypothetical protein